MLKPTASENVICVFVHVDKLDYFSKQKVNTTQTKAKMIKLSKESH